MESETFQQDEELSVDVLHSFRRMLECSPELNERVSYILVNYMYMAIGSLLEWVNHILEAMCQWLLHCLHHI